MGVLNTTNITEDILNLLVYLFLRRSQTHSCCFNEEEVGQ